MGRPVGLGTKATFIKSRYLRIVYCLLIEACERELLRGIDKSEASLVDAFREYLKQQTPFIGSGEMPIWPEPLDSVDGRRVLRRLLESARLEVRSVGDQFPKERIDNLRAKWSNRGKGSHAPEDLPVELLDGPLKKLLQLTTEPPEAGPVTTM